MSTPWASNLFTCRASDCLPDAPAHSIATAVNHVKKTFNFCVVRFADALGTSTDYLLGRTDTLDAPFIPNYVAPPKPPRRMPRSAAELEAFIREIISEQAQQDNLPDA